jgi:hypothetical protein
MEQKSTNKLSINNPTRELLNILKTTGEAIQIEGYDITLGIANEPINIIMMLEFLLAKTRCLPLVPNFTDQTLISEIGITEDQANMIQEFNQKLIYIHSLLQKMIMTYYVISCFSKQMIDDAIAAVPEENMDILLDYIKNFNDPNLIQTGGGPGWFERLSKILFVGIASIATISGEEVLPVRNATQPSQISMTTSSNQELQEPMPQFALVIEQGWNENLVGIEPGQFFRTLKKNPKISSDEVDTSNLVTVYSETRQKELNSLWGKLTYIISPEPTTGQQMIDEFVRDWNDRVQDFSQSASEGCTDLMLLAERQGIFKHWSSMDNIEETLQKSRRASMALQNKSEEIQDSFVKKGMSAISTAAVAIFDPSQWSTVVYQSMDIGFDLIGLLSNTDAHTQQKSFSEHESHLSTLEKKIPLTKTQRIGFESNIAKFSRYYCDRSYNLRLEPGENSMTVIGDNVPYKQMIFLIETLNSNLEFQIKQIVANNPGATSTQDITQTISALVSIQQRLEILKRITLEVEYFIEGSAESQIYDLNERAKTSNKSMDKFKHVFNSFLEKLEDLVGQLGKQFPIKEERLKQTREILGEQREHAQEDQFLKDYQQNTTAYENIREAKRNAKSWQDWTLATRIGAQGIADLVPAFLNFFEVNTQKYISDATRAGTAPAIGFLEGLTGFLGDAVKILVTTTGGWVIIIGLSVSAFIAYGAMIGTVRTFRYGAGKIITITVGPVIFVFQLVVGTGVSFIKYVMTLLIPGAKTPVDINGTEQIQGNTTLHNTYPNTVDPMADQVNNPVVPTDNQKLPEVEEPRRGEPGFDKANYQAWVKLAEEGGIYDKDKDYIKYPDQSNRGGKFKKSKKTRKNKKRRTRKLKHGRRRKTKNRRMRPTRRH